MSFDLRGCFARFEFLLGVSQALEGIIRKIFCSCLRRLQTRVLFGRDVRRERAIFLCVTFMPFDLCVSFARFEHKFGRFQALNVKISKNFSARAFIARKLGFFWSECVTKMSHFFFAGDFGVF